MRRMPRVSTTRVPDSQGTLFTVAKQKAAAAKRRPAAPRSVVKKITPTARPLAPGKKRWLSASSLESMRRCPRCFWLQVNTGLYQPEGIVSRLANRFDGVIKKYFDLYRGGADLPPMIAGQVKGRLETPFQEKYFANITPKYGFLGKLDECLVTSDGKYTPVDHKTASSDPSTRELIPAYQFQLDSYAFLLDHNGKPTTGVGHLIYFYPAEGMELHSGFPMQVTVKTLSTDPKRVRPVIDRAIELLEGPLPANNPDCPFCAYVQAVKDFS